jgi:hypothetical protein
MPIWTGRAFPSDTPRDLGRQHGRRHLVLVAGWLRLRTAHPLAIRPGKPTRPSAVGQVISSSGRSTLANGTRAGPRGWVDSDGMICRAESARSHRRERLSACHMRATRQGAQRIATVAHGQVDADNQDRCSCRSADKSGDRTSKLVMRVRFPSSVLIFPAHSCYTDSYSIISASSRLLASVA